MRSVCSQTTPALEGLKIGCIKTRSSDSRRKFTDLLRACKGATLAKSRVLALPTRVETRGSRFLVTPKCWFTPRGRCSLITYRRGVFVAAAGHHGRRVAGGTVSADHENLLRRADNQRMNAESTHDVKVSPWSPASASEPRLLADIGATYARFC